MKKKYSSGFYFEEAKDLAKIIFLDAKESQHVTRNFMEDFNEVLNYVGDSSEIKTLFINTSTSNMFSFHYSNLLESKDDAIHFFTKWEKLITKLERMPKLTAIFLHGETDECLLHLAMSCDLKMGTEDMKFYISSVEYGLIPGMLVFKLAKYMGLGNANAFILCKKIIDSNLALHYGLLDQIVESAQDVFSCSQYLRCNDIQKKHPSLIPVMRRLIHESFHDTFEDAIGHYLAGQDKCIHSDH